MNKVCDHTSVGILVFHEKQLLLIDRKKPPFGLAAPAGHVDAHGSESESEETQYLAAAKAELQEEAGLKAKATDLKLVAEGRKDNHCLVTGREINICIHQLLIIFQCDGFFC